jgi:hypothetical protein
MKLQYSGLEILIIQKGGFLGKPSGKTHPFVRQHL